MGAIKKALDAALGKQDEAVIIERLNLLLLAAKSKIKEYKEQMNEGFLNPSQIEKIQIPGIRSIHFFEQYHVASSSSIDEDFKAHLDCVFDSFFSIGDKGESSKSAVKEGIKSLISCALDSFIGSTEAGESEERIYFIVPENNAIVRADVAIWKYYMSDKSIVANKDTAIAYLLCKSVVDHTKLTLDELIYITSEALTTHTDDSIKIKIYEDLQGNEYQIDGEAIKQFLNPKIIPLGQIPTKEDYDDKGKLLFERQYRYLPYKGTLALLKDETKRADKVYAENPLNWCLAIGVKKTPPSIQNVKAYLSQLIATWGELRKELQLEQSASE